MPKISVSVLSVDKQDAVSIFYNLETAKVDYFHIDVMDGKFVEKNNLELMKDYAMTISHISNIGLDVHLMVQDVEQIADEYISLEPQIITFHYEALKDKSRIMNMIEEIKQNGIKVGISINPETSIEEIKEFLPYIHQILIMTVNPGKGGQKLIIETLKKIKELKDYLMQNDITHIDIEADGGINGDNAELVTDAGADIIVSGSYIISSEDYKKAVNNLRKD